MNNNLKLGLLELFADLDDAALLALASTITNGLLKNKIDSRESSIQAILNYSQDAESCLKRKGLTKEILFAYMHRHNIRGTLPASKNELIANILDYWKSAEHLNTETTSMEVTAIPNEAPVSELAEQFCNWFYSLLNGGGIQADHFYPDAKMKINSIYPDRTIGIEHVEGDPEALAKKLSDFKITYQMFFNPNLTSEGVQGRVDVHGLVMILACGTLHINNICAGIFQQIFGLVRDPSAENNWKIKMTELNLRSEDVLSTPTLTDSRLTGQYLPLPML